jgi:hypothetical protein
VSCLLSSPTKFPMQHKELLSMIGKVDPSESNLIAFDLDQAQ